jgi:hypothetical protein
MLTVPTHGKVLETALVTLLRRWQAFHTSITSLRTRRRVGQLIRRRWTLKAL